MAFYMASYLLEYAISNPMTAAFVLTNTIGIGNTIYTVSSIAYYSIKGGTGVFYKIYTGKNENDFDEKGIKVKE
jgi:hypothetical protein